MRTFSKSDAFSDRLVLAATYGAFQASLDDLPTL